MRVTYRRTVTPRRAARAFNFRNGANIMSDKDMSAAACMSGAEPECQEPATTSEPTMATSANWNREAGTPATSGDSPQSGTPHRKAISDRKIAANRSNSKKSTGPKTLRGKNHSRGNSMTHGMLATVLWNAVGEKYAEDLEGFHDRLDEENPSTDLYSAFLKQDMVYSYSGYAKAIDLEHLLAAKSPWAPMNHSALVQRYLTTHRRALYHGFKELQRLAAARSDVEETEDVASAGASSEYFDEDAYRDYADACRPWDLLPVEELHKDQDGPAELTISGTKVHYADPACPSHATEVIAESPLRTLTDGRNAVGSSAQPPPTDHVFGANDDPARLNCVLEAADLKAEVASDKGPSCKNHSEKNVASTESPMVQNNAKATLELPLPADCRNGGSVEKRPPTNPLPPAPPANRPLPQSHSIYDASRLAFFAGVVAEEEER